MSSVPDSPDSREWSIQTVGTTLSLTPLDGGGAAVLTATLWAVDGVWGPVVGLLALGAALVSVGPAAFIVAQLGIVSLVPLSELWLLVATQCAAFPLLASAVCSRVPNPKRLGRVAAVYVVCLGGVWVLQANLRWLWQATLTIAVLVAVTAYALHRYERVRVGLVTTDGEQ